MRAPRFVHQPVYVVTSGSIPSGTEELAYDLQALGRGTVVGESTVGAANPVEQLVVHPHSCSGSRRCVSCTRAPAVNWDGVGVRPDILCSPQTALDVAQRAAAERAAGRRVSARPR